MSNINTLIRLEELYDWWFNPLNRHYWFNATKQDDENISIKFGSLLSIESWVEITEITKFNFKQSIGLILLYDQVIRHWMRYKQISDISDTNENKINLLESSYNFIESFVKKFYFKNKNEINGYDFCFTLLFLRHSNSFDNIKYVLNLIWDKLEKIGFENVNSEIGQIYIKYLKATYQRANIDILHEDNNFNYNKQNTNDKSFELNINMHENIQVYIEKYCSVLDTRSLYIYSDNYLKTNIHNEVIAQDCKNIDINSNLIISISGGVDSMVLSWILKKLGYNIILVHINYCNRENTILEQDMILSWGRYLKVRTFYRKIDEINRPKCMSIGNDFRNLYEIYTREQRYKSYIKASKIMNWDNFSVVLGHNHDDCIENVFTNIISKTKWDNLYGMEFNSQIQFKNTNINFVRPFIRISKEQIYEFALRNNIIFLWDSTPKWSQRGKIRDIVRPALIEFNSEIINGIDNLVKILSESVSSIDYIVDSWIRLGFENNPINPNIYFKIEIDYDQLIKTNIFWKKLFNKLKIKVTSKCIDSLGIKIHTIEKNFSLMDINKIEKFQLNKNIQIKFTKNKFNKLLIFI